MFRWIVWPQTKDYIIKKLGHCPEVQFCFAQEVHQAGLVRRPQDDADLSTRCYGSFEQGNLSSESACKPNWEESVIGFKYVPACSMTADHESCALYRLLNKKQWPAWWLCAPYGDQCVLICTHLMRHEYGSSVIVAPVIRRAGKCCEAQREDHACLSILAHIDQASDNAPKDVLYTVMQTAASFPTWARISTGISR
eukprot:scaffold152953_cov25-Tisochrysis_lutea.AAC.1